MEIDQFAASVAHEICNAECFAFTGEGPKPHSAQCHSASRIIADAIYKVCDPLQNKIDRLRDENGLLTTAVHFAHEQGFEWPADPFAFLQKETT